MTHVKVKDLHAELMRVMRDHPKLQVAYPDLELLVRPSRKIWQMTINLAPSDGDLSRTTSIQDITRMSRDVAGFHRMCDVLVRADDGSVPLTYELMGQIVQDLVNTAETS